jgi:predicted PurR-regulated permease PerM
MMTVFLIIAGIYALTLLGSVVQMLIFAFLLAFIMYSPSRFLTRRMRFPWALSVVINYIIFMLVLLGLVLVVLPQFVNGANRVVLEVQVAYVDLQERLSQYQSEDGIVDVLGQQIDFNFVIQPARDFILGTQNDIPDISDLNGGGVVPETTPEPPVTPPTTAATPEPATTTGDTPTTTGDTPMTTGPLSIGLLESVDLQQILNGIFNAAGTVTGTVTSVISSVTGLLSTLLLALFVSFLIMIDLPNTQDTLEKWVSSGYRREYVLLISRLHRVWSGFFRGQVAIGVIIGVLTWIQLSLMGVSGATVLAIFTGIISLIPTIGGFIALIPLAIVPALQGSTVFVDMPNGLFMLLVIGINLIISQVIWNVVAPSILGDILDLPLPVIIVGVFIGAAVGGVLGAFLVAPIMSTIRIVVFYIISKIAQQDPFPGLEPSPDFGRVLDK